MPPAPTTTTARPALQSTRANAATWNATHEDPDITADLELIDLYLANLRATGATGDSALATCGADNPYGDDVYDGGLDHHYACSAGGNPRGLVVIALAGMLAARRRRRAK